MAKQKFPNWAIMPGETRTVYDRDTGEPSQEVVSPWKAEYSGGNGAATVYGADEAALDQAIAGHPFTTNPPASPVVVDSGVQPDPNSLEGRVAKLESEIAPR